MQPPRPGIVLGNETSRIATSSLSPPHRVHARLFDSVVTGSAGFIGSALVDRLLASGERVLGIDSFDPYYSRRAKSANLAGARSNPRFRQETRDLVRCSLRRNLDRETVVYHLAGQPGVQASWGNAFGRYVRNNVVATQRLFEEVARAGFKNRIIYASSSSIYGEQPAGKMGESAVPHPVSPYGVTKLAGEHLAGVYRVAQGLPITSLRFFSVYGPRQRPDLAFYQFFDAVRADRPIGVLGTGEQRRDFTYIDDIIEGVMRAARAHPRSSVLNLGAGRPTRILDAISDIGHIVGREPRLRHRPLPPGDPPLTWADIRRAREEIGYRPRVLLREGLRRQWEWQDARKRGERR